MWEKKNEVINLSLPAPSLTAAAPLPKITSSGLPCYLYFSHFAKFSLIERSFYAQISFICKKTKLETNPCSVVFFFSAGS